MKSAGTPSPGLGAARGFGGCLRSGRPAASRGPSPLGAAHPIVVGLGWKLRSWAFHLDEHDSVKREAALQCIDDEVHHTPRMCPHGFILILIHIHMALLWSRRGWLGIVV